MTPAGVSGLSVAAVVLLCLVSLPALISARECNSIDVRNSIANFDQLNGCTVVKGYLLIVLLAKNISVQDYSNIMFPELREITDYFLLYDVKGLTSFKKLFPNLTVIRGRRLFLNYALVVSNMPDLETFELKSLLAIQRGHVFIGSCPKLCFLNKINWDRTTLSAGENHVIPMADATCPASYQCLGCESDYCWSNMSCQKFENDNLVNLIIGSEHCHPECLGGCYNTTNAGCVVCRGITNHGVCVEECPSDLYYSEHHQRCYTKQECGDVRCYVIGNECNRRCPSGYTSSRRLYECVKCTLSCDKSCAPPEGYNAFVIYNLADCDTFRGCYRLNGSLYIELQNRVDEKELTRAFESVHEVQGHVKIVSSPTLKSLGFLQNLEKIDGDPLENKTFALILYKNGNLQELWSPMAEKRIEFLKGGIYTYSNYKLCNNVLLKFAQRVIHDKDKDLLQLNDQEVLCDPAKMSIEVMHITQNTANISWAINQTSNEVEVLYREAKYSNGEESEMDDHVCLRVIWKRDLMLSSELWHNLTHFSYIITGLLPNTKYEVLVKTFQSKNTNSARSVIQIFTTIPDYPTAPKVSILAKTSDSITLTWDPRNEIKEVLDYYLLETFEQTIDRQTLDERNFCDQPTLIFGTSRLEDYDDCCQRRQQENEDEEFRRDMENTFPCTVKSKENCHSMVANGVQGNTSRIDGRLVAYTVYDLKPSTLYTFFLYGCNFIGCGTYYMYTTKTNYTVLGDKVENVEACRVPETNEYHLMFKEPTLVNGAIVSYIIHFRETPNSDTPDLYRAQLTCVTRKVHEMAGYRYVVTLNDTFEKIAVRTASLAGSAISEWFDVEMCRESKPAIGAIGIFAICCAICIVVGAVWISIRRQLWRNINFDRWRRGALQSIGAVRLEDRQVLVATFDTVAFQNTPDD